MRTRPLILGILIILAAWVADNSFAQREPLPAGTIPVAPTGGVLSCPLATTGSGEAYLYLANVGDTPGRARAFIRTQSREVAIKRAGLAPGQIRTIALHNLVKDPAGVLVEWSGGRIIAAHALHAERTIITPSRTLPRFMSAAQCMEPQGPELAIVGARTTGIGDTTLALFNPGPAPAVVSVAVRVSGSYVEPQRLQRRIVRPLSRRDFSLRKFAFGRDEIAVVIRMEAGRVVAEALLSNRLGAELLTAMPPLTEAMVVSGSSGGDARLSLAATERALISDSGTPIDLPVELTATRYQDGALDAPEEIPTRLGRDVKALIPLAGNGNPVGYAFSPLTGRLAAGVSWPITGAGAFDLVSASAMTPVNAMYAIIPTFGASWEANLLLAAAAGEKATASVRVIGPRPRDRSVDVPPGSVASVPVSGGVGVHAIVVTSDVPVVGAIVARSGGVGYGSSPTSLRISTETAVRVEPEVGLGARAR
jgi:hypothetical protein